MIASHICFARIYFLCYTSAYNLNGNMNLRKSLANLQRFLNLNFTPFAITAFQSILLKKKRSSVSFFWLWKLPHVKTLNTTYIKLKYIISNRKKFVRKQNKANPTSKLSELHTEDLKRDLRNNLLSPLPVAEAQNYQDHLWKLLLYAVLKIPIIDFMTEVKYKSLSSIFAVRYEVKQKSLDSFLFTSILNNP